VSLPMPDLSEQRTDCGVVGSKQTGCVAPGPLRPRTQRRLSPLLLSSSSSGELPPISNTTVENFLG